MSNRYRIIRDGYAGYEVQVWRWWFPFWIQPVTNTHSTVESAEQWAKRWDELRSVVKVL